MRTPGIIFIFFPDKGSLFIEEKSMNSFRRLHPGTPLEGRDGMFIIEDREKMAVDGDE